MLTFFVLLFNHLAYLQFLELARLDPTEKHTFNGMGCTAFFTAPCDVAIVWFIIERFVR